MLGVLTISVVLSIVLAIMDMGSPPVSGGRKKAEMRQKLEDHYFGLGDLKVKQLEPYQILLRKAPSLQPRRLQDRAGALPQGAGHAPRRARQRREGLDRQPLEG